MNILLVTVILVTACLTGVSDELINRDLISDHWIVISEVFTQP